MRVDCLDSRDDLIGLELHDKTVVVIDVLRASSVMVEAFKNGAKAMVPVETVEDAFDQYHQLLSQGYQVKLCGEREANKVPGFHFGNSPLEYHRKYVEDHILIHTTTNGTQTIKAADQGQMILMASMHNTQGIAQALINANQDVVIVCSGTHRQFSMDDAVCAGRIIDHLMEKQKLDLSDKGHGVHQLYQIAKTDYHDFLKGKCLHYDLLLQKGLTDDLDYCFNEDPIPLVPSYYQGQIRLSND